MATDDCGYTYYIQLAGPVNGVDMLVPEVVYTVRYRFYDRFANQSTDCVFTVSLETEPPVLNNCSGNLTVCSPTDPWPVPTATDNCGQVSLVQVAGPVSGVNALIPGVVYTVGYKATDLAGNAATCYFTVSIDNTPPMASCSNQTLTFNGQNSISLDPNTLVTATDDCGIQSITLFPTAITCSQLGQIVSVIATVTDINGNAATCTSSITVAGLPCGWIQNPNGVNCSNGSSIAYNSVTEVWTATSTNCFYGPSFTSDQMAFGQRMLCGDGSITAQVASISGTALGWAGLTMRESSAAGAKKAQLMTNLSNLSRREFRITTDGTALMQQIPSQDRYWLRLVRAGNQFSMYLSPNGLTWYFAGAQNIPMNTCIQMGMVVTNYQQTSIVAATFANVSFSGSIIPLLVDKEEVASYQQRAASFDAYPNPTSGELNVDLWQYVGREVRLEVYSLTGQLLHFIEIKEVQTTVERIDLTAFPSGMYLLKVKSHELPDATRRVVITLY
ncbi:MAG: HYR domain-containing protein [Saprospiraceae bacterium]|nr:HYR domain-containing protein [Saprospiraceae bacterium]